MTTVVDTNVFVHFLMDPVSEIDRRNFEAASSLMSEIQQGRRQALISEIVIHESYYVLVMRYKIATTDAFCSTFRTLLNWPGWVMGRDETAILQRALDILEEHPELEFSDAVIAARAEAHGAELATFDGRLAVAYDGPVWSVS